MNENILKTTVLSEEQIELVLAFYRENPEYDTRYDSLFGENVDRLYIPMDSTIDTTKFYPVKVIYRIVKKILEIKPLDSTDYFIKQEDIVSNKIRKYCRDRNGNIIKGKFTEVRLVKFLSMLNDEKIKVDNEYIDYDKYNIRGNLDTIEVNEENALYKIIKNLSIMTDKMETMYNRSNLLGKLQFLLVHTIPNKKTNKVKLSIVISKNPLDIAAMSTNRRWTSCMSLRGDKRKGNGGAYCNYIKNDIRYGTLIAYIIDENDKEIKDPYARILIKRHINKDNNYLLHTENSVYCDHSFPKTVYDKFVNIVENWCEKTNNSADKGVYYMNEYLYNDTYANKEARRYSLKDITIDELYKYNVKFIKNTANYFIKDAFRNDFYIEVNGYQFGYTDDKYELEKIKSAPNMVENFSYYSPKDYNKDIIDIDNDYYYYVKKGGTLVAYGKLDLACGTEFIYSYDNSINDDNNIMDVNDIYEDISRVYICTSNYLHVNEKEKYDDNVSDNLYRFIKNSIYDYMKYNKKIIYEYITNNYTYLIKREKYDDLHDEEFYKLEDEIFGKETQLNKYNAEGKKKFIV